MRTASAFLLASLLGVSSAGADRTSIHGTASVDAAVTDNVLSAPRGSAKREGDILLTIRPGALFTYALPRMIHELNAEVELTRYAGQADQPTIAFRGGWKAFFLPGPRSEVILTASANRSVVSAIGAAMTPAETMVTLLPINQVTADQVDITEYGSYTATRELRLSQGLFARGGLTDDDGMPRTIVTSGEVGGTVGLDRSFRRMTVSLEAGASVLRLHRDAEMGVSMGSRLDRQIMPRAKAQVRYDFTRKLSGALDGGLAVVIPFGVDPYNPAVERHLGTFPIVGGQFAYSDVWGVATLSARRDVTPNLFVAANTVNDAVSLSGAIPLYWLEENRRRAPRLAALGSFGMQRTQLIEETGDLSSSFKVARIDAGLVYAPRPGISYTVRYELLYQTGDQAPAVGDPIPGFIRNTVYLSAAVRFPSDVAARVPKRRASSVRADRKDLTPIGAEPVVPDLVEAGSEGAGDGE